MSLRMIVLDVGSADSILLVTPGKSAVVVDAPVPRKVVARLEQEGVDMIDSLYYTHDHQDHLPSLSGVVTLIESWRSKRRDVKYVFVPTRVLRRANTSESVDSLPVSRRESLLRHSLDKLDLWNRQKVLQVFRAETNPNARVVDGVTIHVLHPDALFYERMATVSPRKINETSLVLRVEYGEFSALLLADLEGEGLAYLLESSEDAFLKSTVLKIPHHGAWSDDGHILVELLERADPELAVLSVGSRNPHGHVVSQLFSELWRLRCDSGKRLSNFVCTQVTRTCVFSSLEAALTDRKGLPEARPCAGDILVVAESSGFWNRPNAIIHMQMVDLLSNAACCGRADNSSIPLN